jgi:hypothetical protein
MQSAAERDVPGADAMLAGLGAERSARREARLVGPGALPAAAFMVPAGTLCWRAIVCGHTRFISSDEDRAEFAPPDSLVDYTHKGKRYKGVCRAIFSPLNMLVVPLYEEDCATYLSQQLAQRFPPSTPHVQRSVDLLTHYRVPIARSFSLCIGTSNEVHSIPFSAVRAHVLSSSLSSTTLLCSLFVQSTAR